MPMDAELNYNLPDFVDEQEENHLNANNHEGTTPKTLMLPAYLTKSEFKKFCTENQTLDFLIFCIDRKSPVQRKDNIPKEWTQSKELNNSKFTASAFPNEYYVFQIAILPLSNNLANLQVEASNLLDIQNQHSIDAKLIDVLNLGGIDTQGNPFLKVINIPKSTLQVLWIGLNIPPDAHGVFQGTLSIKGDNFDPKVITLNFTIEGDPLKSHGFNDAWRLSRLKWLNSTIANEIQTIPKPFHPITRSGMKMRVLGREIELGDNCLPKSLNSFYSESNTHILPEIQREILEEPFRFTIQGLDREYEYTNTDSTVSFESNEKIIAESPQLQLGDISIQSQGTVHFDGFSKHCIKISSQKVIELKGVQMNIVLNRDSAKYFVGLEQNEGYCPKTLDWQWNIDKYQDCFWIGNVNGGFQLRLKDNQYQRPLVNIYYKYHKLRMPRSWGNNGKGGISIKEIDSNKVKISIFSGPISVTPEAPLYFDFDLFFTPFKPIDLNEQLSTRYLHGERALSKAIYDDPSFMKKISPLSPRNPAKIKALGANVVNIHHAQLINPFINYPYNDESMPVLKEQVPKFHAQNLKIKLYYTTREITINMPEFFPLFHFNGEIIFPGEGDNIKTVIHPLGSPKWFKEFLGQEYIPAWKETLKAPYNKIDYSAITTPDTRWNNFYLEGLNYLIEKSQIDGIYIDDTALERLSLLRARRILDKDGKKRLIDLHSWNHHTKLANYGNSMNIYAEILPFVDRIWFGEGFNYEKSPAYWLSEISGIPFGIMGEMLQGGGNPWRGMLYGMTNRLGWGGDPRSLWDFFDKFDLMDSEFFGYWDSGNPISTEHDQILASCYVSTKYCVIALASWAPMKKKIKLKINSKKLPFATQSSFFEIPKIKGFQSNKRIQIQNKIKIPKGKGLLVILQ